MKYLIGSALLLLSTSIQAADFVAMNAQQRAAFGIQTAAPQAIKSAQSNRYPAKVTVPNAQLRVLGSPLDGVVEALLVAEGEAVRQGQVLARIRSPQLLGLQSDFLEARTRRLLTRETLERERRLHKDGIIAKRRLLETDAKYRELKTAEQRHRQTLMLAGMDADAIQQLAKSQSLSSALAVAAPLDGVVLEQIATAGQRMAASDPLYRIGHLSPLWVEIHVPLEALADTRPGSRVRIADAAIDAEVITVGRMVHGTDQGVLVRAEVKQGSERLRPGQFVEVTLSGTTGADALRVEARAVAHNAGGNYVFVERAGGFAAVPVQIVSSEGRSIVIKSSLTAAQRIVVSGTAALKAAWLGGGE